VAERSNRSRTDMEIITRSRSEWPDDAPVEVVERKGLGHPDTLCDAIAERVCVALCRAYRDRFGTILHHNVDKVLLCGGASHPRFGGGEIVQPIEIYLAGRATMQWRGARVPVDEIAIAACREVLAERLPLHREIRVVSRIRPGASDLTTLFARGDRPLANDTSCGVGFAPLTELERIVLDVDRALRDRDAQAAHPELGSDVKVMGVRRRDRIDLTVACAFVDRHVESLSAYAANKAEACRLVLGVASRASPLDASVALNAADDEGRGDVYLTVTGSSAEAGDDGEVGRGNRVNGLITPHRPMTMEAAAGKNPVNHVGKLYNVAADRIAKAIVAECPDDTLAATCMLVSQIGSPIDEPALVDVTICATMFDRVRIRIEEIVHAELSRLDRLRDDLVAGTVELY
jgi:S-adenosylmethionine synthetase